MSVAHQGRDAEAGAGAQHRHRRMRIAVHRPAERGEFRLRHDGRAPGQGLEVIDQLDRVQTQGL
ncbi:hypothetical protein D3C72_1810610 [compost metagenome]